MSGLLDEQFRKRGLEAPIEQRKQHKGRQGGQSRSRQQQCLGDVVAAVVELGEGDGQGEVFRRGQHEQGQEMLVPRENEVDHPVGEQERTHQRQDGEEGPELGRAFQTGEVEILPRHLPKHEREEDEADAAGHTREHDAQQLIVHPQRGQPTEEWQGQHLSGHEDGEQRHGEPEGFSGKLVIGKRESRRRRDRHRPARLHQCHQQRVEEHPAKGQVPLALPEVHVNGPCLQPETLRQKLSGSEDLQIALEAGESHPQEGIGEQSGDRKQCQRGSDLLHPHRVFLAHPAFLEAERISSSHSRSSITGSTDSPAAVASPNCPKENFW